MLRARQKLGKYRIERRITNGSLAAVYQAFDTIHGIRVALKVPHPSAMDEQFLVDFRREARLAPQLEHPNILPIRDASFIEGRFVIAMPLGEESLGDRMTRRIATGTKPGDVDRIVETAATNAVLAAFSLLDEDDDDRGVSSKDSTVPSFARVTRVSPRKKSQSSRLSTSTTLVPYRCP